MEEDNTIRALIIGATALLLVMTISAIIFYYNTAVKTARTINDTRMDIGELYDKKIEELDGTVVSGIDARNILRNKYESYDSVILTINSAGTSNTITLTADSDGNIKDTEVNIINSEKNYDLELTENGTILNMTINER